MRVTDSARLSATTAGLAKAAERLLEFQRQVSTGKRVSAAERRPVRGLDDHPRAGLAGVDRSLPAHRRLGQVAADRHRHGAVRHDRAAERVARSRSSARAARSGRRRSAKPPPQNLEQLRDAVLRNLNTSFRGEHIFGGAQGSTAPYTKNGAGVVSAYQGSTVEVSVDVEPGARGGGRLQRRVRWPRAPTSTTCSSCSTRRLPPCAPATRPAMSNALDGLGRAVRPGHRAAEPRRRLAPHRSKTTCCRCRRASARPPRASPRSKTPTWRPPSPGMTQAETTYRAALGVAAQLNRLSLMDYLK